MRIFNNFPETSICPICGENTDKQCMLVPIDDSKVNDGSNEEAIPTHISCIILNIRYSKTHALMGLEAKN